MGHIMDLSQPVTYGTYNGLNTHLLHMGHIMDLSQLLHMGHIMDLSQPVTYGPVYVPYVTGCVKSIICPICNRLC